MDPWLQWTERCCSPMPYNLTWIIIGLSFSSFSFTYSDPYWGPHWDIHLTLSSMPSPIWVSFHTSCHQASNIYFFMISSFRSLSFLLWSHIHLASLYPIRLWCLCWCNWLRLWHITSDVTITLLKFPVCSISILLLNRTRWALLHCCLHAAMMSLWCD